MVAGLNCFVTFAQLYGKLGVALQVDVERNLYEIYEGEYLVDHSQSQHLVTERRVFADAGFRKAVVTEGVYGHVLYLVLLDAILISAESSCTASMNTRACSGSWSGCMPWPRLAMWRRGPKPSSIRRTSRRIVSGSA